MQENIKRVLGDMEKYAVQNKVPIISAAAREILLAEICKKMPQRILEVGTAIGYSTVLMAGAAEAEIVSLELSPDRLLLAKQYLADAGMLGRVKLLNGDAAELLPKISGPFDFVYLDAAKGQYLDYLTKILPNLTAGAVIVADNVLFRGWVKGEGCPRRYRTIVGRLRQYIEFTGDSRIFATTIYEMADGIAISYYKGMNTDAEENEANF